MAKRKDNNGLQNRKNPKSKKSFDRAINNRNIIPSVIIACEDSVSSPEYFQQIVNNLKKDKKITANSLVIAKHEHTNPCGVLEDLKKHPNYKDFKHKWIVIDRDKERVSGGGHTADDFNNAISQAKKLKIEVAYSNDCFELWYLLHFDYRNTAITRDEIIGKVIEKLKQSDIQKFSQLDKNNIKNQKCTKLIFETLLDRQNTAIQNAIKLLKSYDNHNPESDNPSTTVHILVEILNNLNTQN